MPSYLQMLEMVSPLGLNTHAKAAFTFTGHIDKTDAAIISLTETLGGRVRRVQRAQKSAWSPVKKI